MLDSRPIVADPDKTRTTADRAITDPAVPAPGDAAGAPQPASIDFLNELDAPSAPGVSRALTEPAPERKRSTLEFLTALDVPTRPSSGDAPLLGEALTEANAPAFPVADPSPETERSVDSVRSPMPAMTENDAAHADPAPPAPGTGAHAGASATTGQGRFGARAQVPAPTPFSWEQGSGAGRSAEAADASVPAPVADAAKPRFSWEAPAPTGAAQTPPPLTSTGDERPRFSWEQETAAKAPPAPDPGVRDHLAPEPAAPRSLRAPRPAPRPVEETIEERRQRLAVRVHTCRDAFRLLGFLGIPDDARSATAQLLIAVEEKLAAGAGDRRQHNPLKEPERFLTDAPREKLDQVERTLVATEDKLLLLDDLVPPTTFRSRIENRDHSRTVLARYARLLASRHFPAGQRRDRFEWLAVRLLTTRGADGELTLLPKERARVVLQHLIGGMPDRAPPDEEAVIHLQESIAKLDDIHSAQEFFESGFYLDAHGYKVSMRDQLLVPDFLYLSVAFSAKVESRLEAWIRGVEGRGSGQAAAASSTREGIRRLLEEQERAVDQIFGAMRGGAPPVEVVERKPPPRRSVPEPEATLGTRIAARIPIRVAMDRNTAIVAGLAALILAVFGWVLTQTGTVTVGQAQVTPLTTEELRGYSPVLISGYMIVSGGERTLQASVADAQWAALGSEARYAAANALARTLRERDVPNGRIALHRASTPVIEITRGELIRVAKEP